MVREGGRTSREAGQWSTVSRGPCTGHLSPAPHLMAATMANVVPRLRLHRIGALVAFDAAAWVLSYLVFAGLRYDQATTKVPWLETLALAGGTVVVYTAVAWVTQLHRGRSALASLEEM